jgi:glutathione S-transferase
MWGIGTTRTIRPLWALAELGLAYEHKKITPRGTGMDEPDFRALTERHKIPFYEDDRVKIGESAAIVNYLADRYSGDVLPMPAPGTRERAILMDHTMYIMTEIDARLYTVRLHGEPPAGLSAIYGAAPTAVEAAKQYVDNSLHEAARWFKDGQQFVMGDHFGTADILLASCLDWALMEEYKLDLPPPLGAYRDRVASRPGYLAAMAQNEADIYETTVTSDPPAG